MHIALAPRSLSQLRRTLYESRSYRRGTDILHPDWHTDFGGAEIFKLFRRRLFDCHRYSGLDAFGAILSTREMIGDKDRLQLNVIQKGGEHVTWHNSTRCSGPYSRGSTPNLAP